MTANPVLVALYRGRLVESCHRGALAVVDGTGQVVCALGDVARPIYPRSAVKALQALAVVESGAAQAFGFGAQELALACASHSGEPQHVAVAQRMLTKAGLCAADLDCGAHWPFRRKDGCAIAARRGKPVALHNNCSGKHAAMLAVARHRGWDIAGYVAPDHPLQQHIAAILHDLTGAHLSDEVCGIDGCSVPTWAMPLAALAAGFARFATGHGLSRGRAEAAQRLMTAVFEHPFLVAGTGRFCTEVMQALPGRAFVKVGAEGVYCAALPEEGLGVALKIDDGARRAAELVLVHLLLTCLDGIEAAARNRLETLAGMAQVNWQGRQTGRLAPAPALEALTLHA